MAGTATATVARKGGISAALAKFGKKEITDAATGARRWQTLAEFRDEWHGLTVLGQEQIRRGIENGSDTY